MSKAEPAGRTDPSDGDLDELMGVAVGLQAVNIKVRSEEGPVQAFLHAGHVLAGAPSEAADPSAAALAERVAGAVRAWIATAEPLRPAHELRLLVGDPSERLVLEWRSGARAPLESFALDELREGPAQRPYGDAEWAALVDATEALVAAARSAKGARITVSIKTRLLRS